MPKPIFSSQEHRTIVESYISICLKFAEDVSTKTKFNNYLEVLDLIIEYHNGYGDGGLREHNFYDWISILPINLSVATSGYFAAIETKKNSAVVRAYKVVLEQALHDTNDKLSLLELSHE